MKNHFARGKDKNCLFGARALPFEVVALRVSFAVPKRVQKTVSVQKTPGFVANVQFELIWTEYTMCFLSIMCCSKG